MKVQHRSFYSPAALQAQPAAPFGHSWSLLSLYIPDGSTKKEADGKSKIGADVKLFPLKTYQLEIPIPDYPELICFAKALKRRRVYQPVAKNTMKP